MRPKCISVFFLKSDMLHRTELISTVLRESVRLNQITPWDSINS